MLITFVFLLLRILYIIILDLYQILYLGLDAGSTRKGAEAVMRRSETRIYQKCFQSDRNKHMRSSENVAGMGGRSSFKMLVRTTERKGAFGGRLQS
jgi:hypothetical protein